MRGRVGALATIFHCAAIGSRLAQDAPGCFFPAPLRKSSRAATAATAAADDSSRDALLKRTTATLRPHVLAASPTDVARNERVKMQHAADTVTRSPLCQA
ncbi:unnamed protein product [Lampetra planeri]